MPSSQLSPQDANGMKGSQETGFLRGPGTGASPRVLRCSHTHPPAPRETYGDDVSLQAVGRVCAFDHGAELGVAHSRLGAGGAHRTWRAGEVEPKERWSRMSRTRYEARLCPWHTAQPRLTGGGGHTMTTLSFCRGGAGGESHTIKPRDVWSSSLSAAEARDTVTVTHHDISPHLCLLLSRPSPCPTPFSTTMLDFKGTPRAPPTASLPSTSVKFLTSLSLLALPTKQNWKH